MRPTVSERIERLLRKLRTLDDGRMADVIELRFGLTDGNEHTLEDIGQSFELTRERIRQIEVRALQYLRRFAEEANDPTVIESLYEIRREARLNAKRNRQNKTTSVPFVLEPRPASVTTAQLSNLRKQVHQGMAHLQSLGIII
jgi:hypothetical protein